MQSTWTELNDTVQSYRLSSVDSNVADFIVNCNPVHNNEYTFDQADSIDVLHHFMVLRMHQSAAWLETLSGYTAAANSQAAD